MTNGRPLADKRSENVSVPNEPSASGSETEIHLIFEDLVRQENEQIAKAESGKKQDFSKLTTEQPGPSGEPWIDFMPVDRVGLAFSGGGIRSATFNLGVLKALAELGVLPCVDYLSTVSGGGYIGAWWTAWRARCGKNLSDKKEQIFPLTPVTGADAATGFQNKPNREPEEVRHLREFSNFLSPRIGFFQSEMWNAVMAVLSAMLPAITVASAVIALAFLIWLGFSSLILAATLKIPLPLQDWFTARWGLTAASPGWLKVVAALLRGGTVPLLLSVLTVIIYFCSERAWIKAGKAEQFASKKSWWAAYIIIPLLILVLTWVAWPFLAHGRWMNPPAPSSPPTWQWAVGISPVPNAVFSITPAFSPHIFDAPIIWAGIAIFLLLPRLVVMRRARERVGPLVNMLDRALSRLLAAALIFAGLAALWLIGCLLNYYHWGANWPAGGALASGGAFALLRNWMGRLGPAKKGGVTDLIKPFIPQILAYLAIVLWAVCIVALMARCIEKHPASPWVLFAIACGIILFAVVAFDPAQVSMHSFYRNRLARAYLGASNPDAQRSSIKNRQTDVRSKDDIQLRELSPDGGERPIHLVCCAANDIGGDHLENLSRGSRSAVLSRFGFAIGNHCHTWKKEEREGKLSLGLAAAITASAAAFNSNMGSLSMQLGAGVTFLCTALNLRLGLWLPYPLTDIDGAPRFFPGLLYLEEMFGMTYSGLYPPGADGKRKPVAKYVHLSDGGHFENLALYELVRRHCRYIIVSDCGADPQVAFDDFGNAVRRIREDFGVEIDIDLSPLKPNPARLSKQHVAVGIITYDPRGDRKDTAVLLYFKPTLTGDEPSDIAQYRTRNQDFPHESTGDQFYDEAQWESYRRLGEHATRSALRFVERERSPEKVSADTVFNVARWEWYQSQDRGEEKILELTGRLTALEQQLQTEAPPIFLREMYPELGTFDQTQPPQPTQLWRLWRPPQPSTAETAERTSKILHLLIQMIQLMEDAWISASLETHWNDPNLLGWMNTFQRWAYTPSFRLWWPILKPMYGRKFRRFMEERLSLADEDYPPTAPKVINRGDQIPIGVAETYWKRMQPQKPRPKHTVYSFELELTDQREKASGGAKQTVQAGLAFVDKVTVPETACWNTEDFFVPPSLWGAGLGAKFLDELLEVLRLEKITRCEVTVQPPPDEVDAPIPWTKRTDLATRQQLNDLLAFYSRAHFTLAKDKDDKKLVRDLTDRKE